MKQFGEPINSVDALYGELEFLQQTIFEHELRIENLESALKNTLQILRFLVESELPSQEQPVGNELQKRA